MALGHKQQLSVSIPSNDPQRRLDLRKYPAVATIENTSDTVGCSATSAVHTTYHLGKQIRECKMATLHQQIIEKFLARLAASQNMDSERLGQLGILLSGGKKPKAEDFVKVFSQIGVGDCK